MNKHPEYEINMELGECYLFSGDFSLSEQHYLRAAHSGNHQPEPYMGLASVAVQCGELDKAIDFYRLALSHGAGDKALAGIGLVHMEKGQHREAIDAFIDAAVHNPRNTIAVNGILRESARLKHMDSIVTILWRCLAANSEKSAIRTAIAETLMKLGHTEAAHEILDAILKENPSDSAAKELRRGINAA